MVLTVGFDLDGTLVDPRPGMVATLAALAAETGTPIDGMAAARRVGIPLEDELAYWFPPADVAAAADRYRDLAADLLVSRTELLAGAAEAIAAVRRHGGRTLVVTAKSPALAGATLDRLGLAVDALHGWCWAEGKSVALRAAAADIYVGDHPADVAAARAAGAVSVYVGDVAALAATTATADALLPAVHAFPHWLSEHLLPGRLARLDDRLRELGSVLVAFSGGADSAFLLAAATRSLGAEHVIAATAISPSLPGAEAAAAAAFAAQLGVRHLTPRTNELSRPGYRANAGDRCYYCKSELLDVLAPLAEAVGVAAIATGTNADDARAGFRPGIAAAAERGAVTPLLDAELTKEQVRAASRAWGLATWDKPAAACLSSRLAYGVPVTVRALDRVGRAETGLRAALEAAGLTVRDLRVRDLGDGVARVELDPALVPVVAARPDLLAPVDGFERVEVDPRGYRAGALNELLPDPERYR